MAKKDKEQNETAEKDKKPRPVSKEERKRVYQKPPLAKIYDKLLPGDYTMSQDRKHALVIFAIIAVMLVMVCVITWFNLEKEKRSVSDTLLIPEMAYVTSQEQTVADMLSGYGFKNITVTDTGITANGTPEMVKAYEDSYREKNIAKLEELLDNDYAELGVDFVDVTDDCKTMTIATVFDLSNAPDEMKKIIVDTDIDKIIRGYATWCRMKNDGEPMTIRFLSTLDATAGSEGTEYYTSTRQNGDSIVADMEAAIQKKAQEEQSGGEEQTQTEGQAEQDAE